MKKIILAIACLFPLAGMAQGTYTISGKMSGLKVPAKAYLITRQGDGFKDKDSVEIKDGKFRFTGTVNEPLQATITIRHKGASKSENQSDNMDFFLENSKISIVGADSIKNATVSGSRSDKELRELEASISPRTKNILKIFKEQEGKPKSEARKRAADSVNMLVAEIKDTYLKFAESHPNSFMGLYIYNIHILDSHFNPAEVKPLFYKFSPQLQSSSLGKISIDRIMASEKRGVGVKIFDFSQTDINGNIFNIASLRGKYVFIDFWASWCHWCRVENPNVLKAYEQLKSKNLEIVSVSFDESRASWEVAVKQDKLPWLQVSDLKGMKVKDGLASMLDIKAIPQNLLINPEGIIIAANLRGEDLPAKLSALIK